MNRTLLSLAIVALLLATVARPPAVLAGFAAGPYDCDMTAVGAKASNGGNDHSYSFTLASACGNIQVRAAYGVTTQEALEILN